MDTLRIHMSLIAINLLGGLVVSRKYEQCIYLQDSHIPLFDLWIHLSIRVFQVESLNWIKVEMNTFVHSRRERTLAENLHRFLPFPTSKLPSWTTSEYCNYTIPVRLPHLVD